jgi:hypothetical protein
MIGGVFLWLGLSIVVAVGANTRGRSPIGWFFCAAIFSPLIAGMLLLALPNLAESFAVGRIYLEGELEGIHGGGSTRICRGFTREGMMPSDQQNLVESFQAIVPHLTEQQRTELAQMLDREIDAKTRYVQGIANLIGNAITERYRQLWENHLDGKRQEVHTLEQMKRLAERKYCRPHA